MYDVVVTGKCGGCWCGVEVGLARWRWRWSPVMQSFTAGRTVRKQSHNLWGSVGISSARLLVGGAQSRFSGSGTLP
jgi:hypothetical protein